MPDFPAEYPVMFAKHFPRFGVAMHNADLPWPAFHAFDEVHQVLLAGMGAVAADGGDAGADGVAFAPNLQVDVCQACRSGVSVRHASAASRSGTTVPPKIAGLAVRAGLSIRDSEGVAGKP